MASDAGDAEASPDAGAALDGVSGAGKSVGAGDVTKDVDVGGATGVVAGVAVAAVDGGCWDCWSCA